MLKSILSILLLCATITASGQIVEVRDNLFKVYYGTQGYDFWKVRRTITHNDTEATYDKFQTFGVGIKHVPEWADFNSLLVGFSINLGYFKDRYTWDDYINSSSVSYTHVWNREVYYASLGAEAHFLRYYRRFDLSAGFEIGLGKTKQQYQPDYFTDETYNIPARIATVIQLSANFLITDNIGVTLTGSYGSLGMIRGGLFFKIPH